MTSLYEVLFIVPTTISEEDFSELSNKIKETIEKKYSFEITKFEKWADRKLAYSINDNENGTYHILETNCSSEAIKEVEGILSFEKSKVLRFLIDKL
ncbi:30S ribosomal protein S6 [bacterium]|nr:30S ribosomal protein S6 [bacterium]|tara:strand:+ start:8435 stop:8725 length:291 start_codon:yes stop_codon:yes gene_type:complete